MKICFFVRYNGKLPVREIEFYRQDIARLEDDGHQVVVVTRYRDLFFQKFDLYFVWWFASGLPAIMYSRLVGKPSIAIGNIHTPDCGDLADWGVLKKLFIIFSLKIATRSIFTSHTDYERIGELRVRNAEVRYHSIDLKLSILDYSQRVGSGNNRNLVTICHLNEESIRRKMLFETINFFEKLYMSDNTLSFSIIGGAGNATQRVREFIAEKNLQHAVTIYENATKETKDILLANALLYIQFSRCEGFGYAPLEAIACGTPILINDDPCLNEIFGEIALTTGQLDEARILALISSRNEWCQLSSSSYEYSRLFDVNKRRLV